MSEIPFHSTRMGQTFYEGTMPRLVRELARLNENIERLLAVAEGTQASESTAPKKDGAEDRP